MYPRDLRWVKFDKLRALEKVGSTGNGSIWNCLCDCGKEIKVARCNLISKGVKSCGCIQKGTKSKPNNEHCKNSILNSFKQRSKKKKIEFSIESDKFFDLISKECYYCGLEYSNHIKKKYGEIKYNGLDRIDNTKGYEINNVRTCCSTCNVMKLTLTENEFYNHIKQIYNFRINTDNH